MTRFALIGLLVSSLAAAALADPRTATISVTTADMASPAARNQLDRRIGIAIEQVCGSYATVESYQVPEVDTCWNSARREITQRLAEMHGQTRIQLASH